MPTPSKHIHREWTPEEDETLRRLHLDGLSRAEIAREIAGRSRNAVTGRCDRLGLTRDGVRRPPASKRWASPAAKANRARRQAEQNEALREAAKVVGRVTRTGRREGVDDEWARAEILAHARDPYEPPPFAGYDPARDPKPDWLKFSFQREQGREAA
jgi:hypothetical protein